MFKSPAFTQVNLDRLVFEWDLPTIDQSTMLPIDSYKIYWDEGYLSSGEFKLLDTLHSFEHNFYEAKNLVPGKLYKF